MLYKFGITFYNLQFMITSKTERAITIRVNGTEQHVPKGMTLTQLIELFKLKKKAVALELNHQVIDRSAYETRQLYNNDTVEIVQFVGGG